MDLPSDDDLLAEYAEPASRPGEWVLKGRDPDFYTRIREAMLAVIKMHVLLDRPVTDVMSGEFMYEVVRRIVALEERLATRV